VAPLAAGVPVGVSTGVGFGVADNPSVGVAVGAGVDSDAGAAAPGFAELVGATMGDGGADGLPHAARTTPRRSVAAPLLPFTRRPQVTEPAP